MIRIFLAAGVLAGLSACSDGGGNPFDPPTEPAPDPGDDGGQQGDDGGDSGDDPTRPIDADGNPVPGTAVPTPDDLVVRAEPRTEGGDGFARNVAYQADTDTFTVDNLAFDGSTAGTSSYNRDDRVANLGPFAVYESGAPAIDPINDRPIDQFIYKAIYGVSQSGDTEFAIVRTGSYIPYGFGGFVYQRDGGVTLPTTGQASYRGAYAGLRDFDGRGGLEYATADAAIDIDFEDFDEGDGVRGSFANRRVFDLAGDDVTQEIVAAFNAANPDSPIGTLPVIQFRVGPGVTTPAGEILGEAFSVAAGEAFEEGSYYALVSGDDAEEIVGIVVVSGADPRFEGVTVRETGGFVVAR